MALRRLVDLSRRIIFESYLSFTLCDGYLSTLIENFPLLSIKVAHISIETFLRCKHRLCRDCFINCTKNSFVYDCDKKSHDLFQFYIQKSLLKWFFLIQKWYRLSGARLAASARLIVVGVLVARWHVASVIRVRARFVHVVVQSRLTPRSQV